MNNELKTIDNCQNYPSLSPDSDIAEAIKANFAAGESMQISDLTKISVPSGGGLTWSWSDIYGDHEEKSIEGVLVLNQTRQTLWPRSYDNSTGEERPVLISFDGIKGHLIGDDFGELDKSEIDSVMNPDGTVDMLRLSYNQWGSGRNGGKMVRDERVLFLLQPNTPWPVVVNVPPMSLNNIRAFLKKLHVPYYRAIVSLTLENKTNGSGKKYSAIVPNFVGELNKEEAIRVFDLYTKPLGDSFRKI